MSGTPYRRTLASVAGAAVLALLGTQPVGAAQAPPAAPSERAATQGASGAQDAGEARDARTLKIHTSATELTAPSTATPGPTTFRTTTDVAGTGWVALAELKDGTTEADFLRLAQRRAAEGRPLTRSDPGDLDRISKALGGTVIYPDTPASFTQTLEPGEYLLYDATFFATPDPKRLQRLTVGGERSGSTPKAEAELVSTMTGDKPRFELSGTLRAGEPLKFTNAMPEPGIAEAILFPLADGVTERDLVEWFDKFGDGGEFPDDPGPLTDGTGALTMNAGVSQTVQLTLRPGRHVVINWTLDPTDGRMYLKKGHYLIIDVK